MKSKTIHIRPDKDHWTVEFRGKLYGPYACKDEASSIAKIWAENAAKQGHCVQVVIHDAGEPASTVIEMPLDEAAGPIYRI